MEDGRTAARTEVEPAYFRVLVRVADELLEAAADGDALREDQTFAREQTGWQRSGGWLREVCGGEASQSFDCTLGWSAGFGVAGDEHLSVGPDYCKSLWL
jgi:hypothetical protein